MLATNHDQRPIELIRRSNRSSPFYTVFKLSVAATFGHGSANLVIQQIDLAMENTIAESCRIQHQQSVDKAVCVTLSRITKSTSVVKMTIAEVD